MIGVKPIFHSIPMPLNTDISYSAQELVSKIRNEILFEKNKSIFFLREIENEKTKVQRLENLIKLMLGINGSKLQFNDNTKCMQYNIWSLLKKNCTEDFQNVLKNQPEGYISRSARDL